jgi:hypothetical protein
MLTVAELGGVFFFACIKLVNVGNLGVKSLLGINVGSRPNRQHDSTKVGSFQATPRRHSVHFPWKEGHSSLMNNMKTWFACAIVIAGLSIDAEFAIAQFPVVLSFEVNQRPQPGGGLTYELAVGQLGLTTGPSGGGTASLTAPSGLVFAASKTTMNFNTFAELGNTLFGNWTGNVHPSTGPDGSYKVRVSTFTLSDVFTETPFITSPVPGSTVPNDFVVKWSFPSGATSGTLYTEFSNSNLTNSSLPQFGVDGTYSVAFHTQIIQPVPASMSLEIGTQTYLTSPTVSNRTGYVSATHFDTFLSFNSRSLAATFNVVPEPSGAVLSVGIFALLASRRHRK